MASLKEVPLSYGVGSQRAALEAVLRSRMFLKNPRLSALLEYLCERCFEGEAESIKEFNIAIDVFDRPADFDQSQDAIVRVEMHRLRKKLAEFYATEGQQQPVEIVIQSGHYLPEFVVRQVEGAAAVEAFADSARNGIKEIDEAPPGGLASRKRIWLVAGLMAAAVAAIVITRVDWRGSPSEKRLHAADPNATELPVASGLPNQGVHILCGLSTMRLINIELARPPGKCMGCRCLFLGRYGS